MALHDAVSTVSTSSMNRSYSTGARTSMSGTMLMGFLCGACTGLALGLLFAPTRGSAVRSTIADYASQGRDRVGRMIETGSHWASDAVHQASSLMEEGRRALRTSDTSRYSSPEPLTASVAEISGIDRRFEEPLGG